MGDGMNIGDETFRLFDNLFGVLGQYEPKGPDPVKIAQADQGLRDAMLKTWVDQTNNNADNPDQWFPMLQKTVETYNLQELPKLGLTDKEIPTYQVSAKNRLISFAENYLDPTVKAINAKKRQAVINQAQGYADAGELDKGLALLDSMTAVTTVNPENNPDWLTPKQDVRTNPEWTQDLVKLQKETLVQRAAFAQIKTGMAQDPAATLDFVKAGRSGLNEATQKVVVPMIEGELKKQTTENDATYGSQWNTLNPEFYEQADVFRVTQDPRDLAKLQEIYKKAQDVAGGAIGAQSKRILTESLGNRISDGRASMTKFMNELRPNDTQKDRAKKIIEENQFNTLQAALQNRIILDKLDQAGILDLGAKLGKQIPETSEYFGRFQKEASDMAKNFQDPDYAALSQTSQGLRGLYKDTPAWDGVVTRAQNEVWQEWKSQTTRDGKVRSVEKPDLQAQLQRRVYRLAQDMGLNAQEVGVSDAFRLLAKKGGKFEFKDNTGSMEALGGLVGFGSPVADDEVLRYLAENPVRGEVSDAMLQSVAEAFAKSKGQSKPRVAFDPAGHFYVELGGKTYFPTYQPGKGSKFTPDITWESTRNSPAGVNR